MTILFFVLIVLACLLLGFVVLIQNPKGGGLSSAVGGFSNQVMGVKQTTDVLEKGTWLFAGIVGALCLFSTLFIKTGTAKADGLLQKVNTTAPAKAPAAAPVQAPATAPATVPATK